MNNAIQELENMPEYVRLSDEHKEMARDFVSFMTDGETKTKVGLINITITEHKGVIRPDGIQIAASGESEFTDDNCRKFKRLVFLIYTLIAQNREILTENPELLEGGEE